MFRSGNNRLVADMRIRETRARNCYSSFARYLNVLCLIIPWMRIIRANPVTHSRNILCVIARRGSYSKADETIPMRNLTRRGTARESERGGPSSEGRGHGQTRSGGGGGGGTLEGSCYVYRFAGEFPRFERMKVA